MFETRWRWNATRSLALLRTPRRQARAAAASSACGRTTCSPRSSPAQTACQDNHGGGAIEMPDHPLVRETHPRLPDRGDGRRRAARRCCTTLRARPIQTLARELPEPSVFSHEILNANPYAFLDDAPLEERRTRAVSVRRGLPAEVAERLGGARSGGDRRRSWPRRSPTCATPTSCTICCSSWARCPRRGRGRAAGTALVRRAASRRAARGAARRARARRRRSLGGGRAALARRRPSGRAALRARRRRAAGAPRAALVRRATARSPRWCAAHLALRGPTTAARARGAARRARRGRRRRAGARRAGGTSARRSTPLRAAAQVERRAARDQATHCSGATAACSRASTGARWTGCGARSSR